MDNNWIIDNLNYAFGVWNDKLTEMWSLLSQSPQAFKGGTIWQTIQTVNGAMQGIGYGLLVLFLAPEPMNRYIAVIIFIVASLTDMLDGKIARKYNMVSNFGKFMDPLADKLLVMSALVSMVALKDLAAWVVIVILAREFAITGFRTLAMEANIVMAASWWGKVKTTTQMIMIPVLLLNLPFACMPVLEKLLVILAVFFTIFSGADYIIKNKQVLMG